MDSEQYTHHEPSGSKCHDDDEEQGEEGQQSIEDLQNEGIISNHGWKAETNNSTCHFEYDNETTELPEDGQELQ